MLRVAQRLLSPLLLDSHKIIQIMAQAALSSAPFTPPAGKLINKTTIDKESFRKQVTFPAIHVKCELISKCRKVFKQSLIHRKKFRFVRDDPANEYSKYLLLNPEKVKDIDSLSEQERTFLEEIQLEKKLHNFETDLTYDDWTHDEVLRAVLPQGVEVPMSFSTIGHIAHLNLRVEQLDYKHLIGQVLLDKNSSLRTVVNKVNEISNEFRFFKMELMAGEDNMVALVREHGVSFQFDFSKVYWNPRLSTEHTRIASHLGRDDILYDMFAGVGPFAIPAAKRKCVVLANDLNPESFKWLTHNIKLNKVQDRVTAFNMDARKFVQEVITDDLISCGEKCKNGHKINTHVVMNLPSLAIEFLDVFCNLLKHVPADLRHHIPLPTIHCHCFSKADDTDKDIHQRIKEVLGENLDLNICMHDVRDVAPNKEMMCATFSLPQGVVFGSETNDAAECTEPDTKKQRCE